MVRTRDKSFLKYKLIIMTTTGKKGQYNLSRRWLDGTNCVIFYDNSGTAENRTHNNVNELTARDAANLTYNDIGILMVY